MRQAYDYWQDQPGSYSSFLAGPGSPPLLFPSVTHTNSFSYRRQHPIHPHPPSNIQQVAQKVVVVGGRPKRYSPLSPEKWSWHHDISRAGSECVIKRCETRLNTATPEVVFPTRPPKLPKVPREGGKNPHTTPESRRATKGSPEAKTPPLIESQVAVPLCDTHLRSQLHPFRPGCGLRFYLLPHTNQKQKTTFRVVLSGPRRSPTDSSARPFPPSTRIVAMRVSLKKEYSLSLSHTGFSFYPAIHPPPNCQLRTRALTTFRLAPHPHSTGITYISM